VNGRGQVPALAWGYYARHAELQPRLVVSHGADARLHLAAVGGCRHPVRDVMPVATASRVLVPWTRLTMLTSTLRSSSIQAGLELAGSALGEGWPRPAPDEQPWGQIGGQNPARERSPQLATASVSPRMACSEPLRWLQGPAGCLW